MCNQFKRSSARYKARIKAYSEALQVCGAEDGRGLLAGRVRGLPGLAQMAWVTLKILRHLSLPFARAGHVQPSKTICFFATFLSP